MACASRRTWRSRSYWNWAFWCPLAKCTRDCTQTLHDSIMKHAAACVYLAMYSVSLTSRLSQAVHSGLCCSFAAPSVCRYHTRRGFSALSAKDLDEASMFSVAKDSDDTSIFSGDAGLESIRKPSGKKYRPARERGKKERMGVCSDARQAGRRRRTGISDVYRCVSTIS